MIINSSLGCSDLEAVELRMLRGVRKERSKNTDPGLQASIRKHIQKTSWWDPVGGHCPNAKKEEVEMGEATKEEFRNITYVCRDCVGKAKTH